MLVIKLGGAAGVDYSAACRDIQQLVQAGERVVVVHGGSDSANSLGEALGKPPRFLTSPTGVKSRYTDAETLEVATMAMTGRVNPVIVSTLLQMGVQAIGLAGYDGHLLQAKRKAVVKANVDGKIMLIRDDLTGKITSVNAALLHLLLDNGYVPVISPPAFDPEVGPVNVDADRTAAAVAAALLAERLVILSNVPGLMQDPNDPDSLIREIAPEQMEQAMEVAKGRMKLKLIASGEALAGGVKKVILADGRVESPVTHALQGQGTVLVASVSQVGGAV